VKRGIARSSINRSGASASIIVMCWRRSWKCRLIARNAAREHLSSLQGDARTGEHQPDGHLPQCGAIRPAGLDERIDERIDEARRGNPVAIEPPQENGPLGNEQPDEGAKDLLH
jgi:hypothetical protein